MRVFRLCRAQGDALVEGSFQADGKAINDKLRLYGQVGQALLEAKQNGSDPLAAIETVVSWEDFTASIAEAQKLAQQEDFDFLYRVGEGYATVRRYAPELLNVLGLHAAPAAKPVLDAIELLRQMNAGGIRELPDDAPLDFIRERWARLIFTDTGIDRRYYELCALAFFGHAVYIDRDTEGVVCCGRTVEVLAGGPASVQATDTTSVPGREREAWSRLARWSCFDGRSAPWRSIRRLPVSPLMICNFRVYLFALPRLDGEDVLIAVNRKHRGRTVVRSPLGGRTARLVVDLIAGLVVGCELLV